MTGPTASGSSAGSGQDLPSISVVIPARNEEDYIASALSSVLVQEYPKSHLEAIVVDNASTDHTASVVAMFADVHPGERLHLVSEQTPGVGRAKNAGAEKASGQVLVFLDADSRMARDLAREVALLYTTHAAGSIRVSADGGTSFERAFFSLMEFGKVRFGIRAQMMYCDRGLFLRLGGFRPDLQIAEDLDFLKRVGAYLKTHGGDRVAHLTNSEIATSPRRLRRYPYCLGILEMFGRWILAFLGIGRGHAY